MYLPKVVGNDGREDSEEKIQIPRQQVSKRRRKFFAQKRKGQHLVDWQSGTRLTRRRRVGGKSGLAVMDHCIPHAPRFVVGSTPETGGDALRTEAVGDARGGRTERGRTKAGGDARGHTEAGGHT